MSNPRNAKPSRARRGRNRIFSRWMQVTGLRPTDVALMVECSLQAVSNWRGGHTRPGRERANRIELVSSGAVPASSWDRP